jgi:ferritin-like metal-binding protein YciE/sporulation protein YlmC with PRC-barrel domain
MEFETQKLEELSNSNYEIRDGEPDITGWSVFNSEGYKIGEIQDLLFDPEARKVRYIVLQLQANGQDVLGDDRDVLIPIGVAKLLADDEQITLPLASAQPLAGLPAYETGNLTPETELRVREVFETGSTAPYEHPQFYAHAHFNEDRFYNRETTDQQTDLTEEDPGASADRAWRASRIVAPIDPEFATEPSFEGAAGEYDQPEPESLEQEQAWEASQEIEAGGSKLMAFFINELKDLLWAERALVSTLPDLAESATSAELKSAFEFHLKETEIHVSRLEQIFGILGLEPESRKCEAMAGILDEGDEIISATGEATAQRDVGLIFAGQKAEHYEIASYGGMIALSKTLGYYEIAELFVLTLDEEKTADAKLTEIAESQANYDASTEKENEY